MDSKPTTPNDTGSILKIIIITLIVLILAVSVMAAFFSARSKGRDRIRVQDISLIVKFLEAYKTNQGYYPPASNGLPTDWAKYLEKLPIAPGADGSCTNLENTYRYAIQNNGQEYSLSFCLGSSTDNYHAGVNTVTNP